jgi:hypothetical protein
MTRLAPVGLVLGLCGCVIPFVHSTKQERHTPDAVRRFAERAQALARTPGNPGLPEVTRSMSVAIDALDIDGAEQLALEVEKKAEAMRQPGGDQTALARASLDVALEAIRRVQPAVPKPDKDKVVEAARQAIEKVAPGQEATINVAYGEVAHAMVVVSGGHPRVQAGSELSQLVSRFAVEEPEDARRTGAQVLAAMADALQHVPGRAKGAERELRKRAEELAKASPLDYAGQLKEALSKVIGSLPPGPRLDEAKVAVQAIRADRPLDLQQAAAVDALRLVSDALGVSAR